MSAHDRHAEQARAAQEQYEFSHPATRPACPTCLHDYQPPQEDHAPALLAALRDVIAASTDLAAHESVPRALWAALQRADEVVADVMDLPF